MDRIPRLIEQLHSPDQKKRYEACEDLRNSPALPESALAALRQAAYDPEPEVADAAWRAVALHTGMKTKREYSIERTAPPPPPSPAQQRRRAHLLLSIGVLALALGAGMCLTMDRFVGFLDRRIGPNPQCSWPATPGSITGSDLQNHVRPNGEDDWQYTVWFAYEANGSPHTAQQQFRDFDIAPQYGSAASTSMDLFKLCGDLPSRAEALVLFRAAHDNTQFVPGRPVMVYYNPRNSDEAVLVAGMTLGYAMSYGEVISSCLAGGLPIAGLLMCFFGIRRLLRAGTSAPSKP